MTDPINAALEDVRRYYSERLREHGATPVGVDWNSAASQRTRFEQLARLLGCTGHFSINDLGCGYGAFFSFLAEKHRDFTYTGIDLSESMVYEATRTHAGDRRAAFHVGSECPRPADYTVASGIFNVRLHAAPETWERYIASTLDHMNSVSLRGFAFNCLTSYSDPPRMRPDLHYADPCALFDRCQRKYSRSIALLHDYGLYEFTILVRKAAIA